MGRKTTCLPLDDQTCDITALTEMLNIKKEKQIDLSFRLCMGSSQPMEAFAMKLPPKTVHFLLSLYLWRRSWHGDEAVFQALPAGQRLRICDAK